MYPALTTYYFVRPEGGVIMQRAMAEHPKATHPTEH